MEKQHRHWERALDVRLRVSVVCVTSEFYQGFPPCLKVYERGLDAIPLSVELWLSYIAYIKELAQGQSQTPKTIERIRR